MSPGFDIVVSTVLRSSSKLLGTILMRLHQLVCVLRGTCSMIPRAIFLSRSFFTFSAQWSGTGTGVCTATCFTFGSTIMSIVPPASMGKAACCICWMQRVQSAGWSPSWARQLSTLLDTEVVMVLSPSSDMYMTRRVWGCTVYMYYRSSSSVIVSIISTGSFTLRSFRVGFQKTKQKCHGIFHGGVPPPSPSRGK